MIPLTFAQPALLSNPLLYERFGAIIKERATGKIIGHVQELARWDMIRHIPIPGGNPLELMTQIVSNVQLHRIQQTLNTVQTLATVGAVASVASLGVSVAGFATVLAKLSRIEGKLDRVLAEASRLRGLVEQLHVKLDMMTTAVLRARLEEVSMARLYGERRRRDSLRDSVEKLAELRHYYGALLASREFCEMGTEHIPVLLDTQERLVAVCEGELFAEFLMGEDPRVISERWRNHQTVFDSIAWRTPASLYALAEQGDRDARVFLVTPATERRAKVQALADVREESIGRLASLPALAECLHARGIGPDEYLKQVEDQGLSGVPLVVCTS